MRKYAFICYMFILIAASCTKNETITYSNLGYAYFPIDSGWVKTYTVDSIAYNDNDQSVDTFHFLLQERFLGNIVGIEGEYYREIERLVQTDTNKIWEPRNSYFVSKTNNNVQVIDENIRVVKMVFPIGNVLSWNGNQYNNLGRRTFFLQNIYAPFNNGDTTFGKCITIQEALANNAIEEILVKNVYQDGIGLVDATNNYVNTQIAGKSGYKVRQKLISYKHP
jgi:hypothetical protein